MTSKEIAAKQKELDEEKERLIVEHNLKYQKRAKAAYESRERAKERQLQLEPFIIAYVKKEIKEGDIIRCKQYRGEKKVVEMKDSTIIAICGDMSRKTGKFVSNGAGSETYLDNVTEVFRDNKWYKIKDLIKDYKF